MKGIKNMSLKKYSIKFLMIALTIIIFIVYIAWDEKMGNEKADEGKPELEEQVEVLEEENRELIDANWILSDALQDAEKKIQRLEREVNKE